MIPIFYIKNISVELTIDDTNSYLLSYVTNMIINNIMIMLRKFIKSILWILKTCLKEENALAFYIPYAAHYLNLIGKSSSIVVWKPHNYFFFQHHHFKPTGRKVPKFFLGTRHWSSSAEAVNVMINIYDNFINALEEISQNSFQKPCIKLEATNLKTQMRLLEAGVILEYFEIIFYKISIT